MQVPQQQMRGHFQYQTATGKLQHVDGNERHAMISHFLLRLLDSCEPFAEASYKLYMHVKFPESSLGHSIEGWYSISCSRRWDE